MKSRINEYNLSGLGIDEVRLKEDMIYAKRRNQLIKKKKLSEAKKNFYNVYKKLW